MTTRDSRDPSGDDAPAQRCCSAEAAVMHWALRHIAAKRPAPAETADAAQDDDHV